MKPIISRWGGGGITIRTNDQGPVLDYEGHLGDIGNSDWDAEDKSMELFMVVIVLDTGSPIISGSISIH